MIGPEGVAATLLAALQTALVDELDLLRDALEVDTATLPDPREWQDFDESRGTWDASRLPVVQLVVTNAGPMRAADIRDASDSWTVEYAVQVAVISHGTSWAAADRRRKRYALAVRQTLIRLGEVDDAPIAIDVASMRERYVPLGVSEGGVAVLTTAAVTTFTARVEEELTRPTDGTVESVELFVVHVRGAIPPDPLPDVEDLPAPIVIP